MKINDVPKIYNIYETQPAAGKPIKKAQAAGGSDRLMLSRDAVDLQAVMKGLKKAPDVRADKVSELTQKYNAGEHLASNRDLADVLYKSGIMKKVREAEEDK